MIRVLLGDFAGTDPGLIRVANLPVTTAKAVDELGGGSISATVRLPLLAGGAEVPVVANAQPWRHYLAFCDGDTIIQAGPITGVRYSVDSGDFEIIAASVDAYYRRRFVIPPGTTPETLPAAVSSWTTSLRTLMKRIIAQAAAWLGLEPVGMPPVVFEADVDGDNIRNYQAIDFLSTDDALTNLSNVIGGPEYAYRAEFADTRHVRWRLTTGDPLLVQSGAPHSWNLAVPGASAKGTEVSIDGDLLTSRAWASGDEISAVADDGGVLVAAGWPYMETHDSYTTVTEQPTLDAHAGGRVAVGGVLRESWQFQALAAGTPKLGTYRAGDRALLIIPKNPVRPAGVIDMRILRISADLSPWVTVEAMPTIAEAP